MRLYNLDGRSITQLKELSDMVKASPDLTMEEKDTNLAAINALLGNRDISGALVESSEFELED